MSQKYLVILTTVLCGLSTPIFAQEGANGDKAKLESIAPYPAADDGMARQVIHLPKQDDETSLRVELVAGKVMQVDCNQVMIGAELTSKTLEGWGYDYLVLDNLTAPATTRMACLGAEKIDRFVALNLGPAANIRYNSKLPIVVYAPKEISVKYRLWKADEQLIDAELQ